MAALPIPEIAAYRYMRYVEELREFFATANLHFGTVEDLAGLAERLQTPGAFTDDLSSLMRSFILREGGALPQTDLLDILTCAAAGQQPGQIEKSPETVQQAIRPMQAFVVSLLRRPWNEPPSQHAAVADRQAASGTWFESIGEIHRSDRPGTGPSADIIELPAQSLPPSQPAEYSPALGAALASAIGTNEPLAWPSVSPPANVPPSLHSEPDSAAGGAPPANVHHKSNNRRVAAIAVACAIAVVLFFAVGIHSHPSGESVAVRPVPAVASSVEGPSTLSHTKPTADGPAFAAAKVPRGNTTVSSRSAPRTFQANPDASIADEPEGAAAQRDSPFSGVAGVTSAPASQQADVSREQSLSGVTSVGGGSFKGTSSALRRASSRRGTFDVSSGVMASNLVSSPDPSYPMLARLAHIQGEVIMQAVISRDGHVVAARVLSGHRLLRGAAVSAVRRWRYRPYVVDGHPVNVATIVSVDFHNHD